MANFYGVNAKKLLDTMPPGKAGIGEANGRERILYDEFDLSAALTTSDTLFMGSTLPKGARITDAILKATDQGTTGDFNVGWQASEDGLEVADADGIFAAADVNAADTVARIGYVAGLFKKFAAPVQIVIAPSESGTAITGKVCLAIKYVVD